MKKLIKNNNYRKHSQNLKILETKKSLKKKKNICSLKKKKK